MTEIAPGVYVHAGAPEEASAGNDDAIANIGFIIGDDAVMVIDPGGSAAEGEELHAAVRAVTSRPIRYVVLTHVHPDHIFGAAAFRADHPAFIGHARLPGALAQRGEYYVKTLRRALGEAAAGSEIVAPTRLVAAREAIDLGNRMVDIEAHGPAHTDNDLTLFDRRTATLWLSDLLFVERIPVIDGSLVGWIKELEAMRRSTGRPPRSPSCATCAPCSTARGQRSGRISTSPRRRATSLSTSAANGCSSTTITPAT
jgi:quinoprotein relay system zinc metallohydrolase 2